ncbi:MAG: aldo/keto reductase [Candidatus Thermoplasmatota archaeon]|nr:aldo/keto reductase [Candidatus Thermoplasmatota archaeon]
MGIMEFGSSHSVRMPDIGMGTWKMGGEFTADTSRDTEEIEALKAGLDIGYSFIDTAEMYGAGHAEELVGRAISGRDVFIATKVWQTNLGYDDVLKAADRSLRRLGRKTIDLYQIHWPNDSIPLRDTMRAMEKLVEEGKIAHIGVSNFDVELIEDAMSHLSRNELFSNQISYSLVDRRAENGLLNYCKKQRIGIIAYEPLARGKVFKGRTGRVLAKAAEMAHKTEAQVALNWIMSRGAVPIPKASSIDHLKENFGASGWRLSGKVLQFMERELGQ